ncbi:MAG: chitobiase/beta-hexosaminidase C-terminal domain-containing protein [Chitinophagaceae bacterium]|nr:chitobiase/beta-hexosaminidase C-terminal domain-containing protein [Chitinophagaceae bacterium]
MRILALLILTSWFAASKAQPAYQLAPPLLRSSGLFFSDTAQATLSFAMAGARIHYTLDGSQPTPASPLYQQPLSITRHRTMLKAAVFADGYTPSTVVSQEFYAPGLRIAGVSGTLPHERYAAPASYLYNSQDGGTHHASGQWLGYQCDSISWTIDLAGRQPASQMMLHVLYNPSAWIFLPRQISVYNQAGSLLHTLQFTPEAQQPAGAKALWLSFRKGQYRQLRVVIHPLNRIPDWHDGRGTPGWCFIDELKVY